MKKRPNLVKQNRASKLYLTAVIIFFFLVVIYEFPLIQVINQHSQLKTASSQLRNLELQNQELTTQVKNFDASSNIEQLARQDFGLIKPGEKEYMVLASAALAPKSQIPPAKIPDAASTQPKKQEGSSFSYLTQFAKRVLVRLEFWN